MYLKLFPKDVSFDKADLKTNLIVLFVLLKLLIKYFINLVINNTLGGNSLQM